MRVLISFVTSILAATTSILPAQRTWIVDQAAAVGFDFADIRSAVQVARSGDTILVSRGTYLAPTVSTGIKLIGKPGARINSSMAMLIVRDLPKGETFVMAGFTTQEGYATRLVFLNNRGKIMIEDVNTAGTPTGIERSAGATIADSDFVSFNRCDIKGTPGIISTGSRVLINDCKVSGFSNWKGRFKGPALQAVDSKIDVVKPKFYGATDSIGPLAASAIKVQGGWLNIGGDATSVIEGGSPGPGSLQLAIEADKCAVRYDTDIRLNPSVPGSRELGGTARFIPESIVAVTASGLMSPNSELSATVMGPAFSPAILFISLPQAPRPTRYGTLWLDVASSFVLSSDFLDATGHWSMSYSVPQNLPSGLTATLQAFVDTGTQMELSQPALIVSH